MRAPDVTRSHHVHHVRCASTHEPEFSVLSLLLLSTHPGAVSTLFNLFQGAWSLPSRACGTRLGMVCCATDEAGACTNGEEKANCAVPKNKGTFAAVSEYYCEVLKSSKDLKTGACTAGGAPPRPIREILSKIPDEVKDKFYGCGAPLPQGIEGLHVLDLGSGSGRDCYVCSALVGEEGSVTGIDMTDAQNEVAKRYAEAFTQSLGYSSCNMKFVTGHIEFLDRANIADNSVDLVISNCVVNLSPDKPRVIQEAFRVLRPGGELHFSDVYANRRVPADVQRDKVMWGECIAGALYINDFLEIARQAGFADPRILHQSPVAIHDGSIQEAVGNISFYSITFRLFKLPGALEPSSEDYGHFVRYKGSIAGQRHAFQLDKNHVFEAGRNKAVCGNTAAMLGENGCSWLSRHFEVMGDRKNHFGPFQQVSLQASQQEQQQQAAATAPASCC